jgi:hypothetical protein
MRLFLLTAMILVMGNMSALACSPAPHREGLTPEILAEEILEENPYFLGRVHVSEVIVEDYKAYYTMDVVKQYAGAPVKTLKLVGDQADSCMAYHEQGSEFLLRLMDDKPEPQPIDMFNSYFAGMNVEKIEAYLERRQEKPEEAVSE